MKVLAAQKLRIWKSGTACMYMNKEKRQTQCPGWLGSVYVEGDFRVQWWWVLEAEEIGHGDWPTITTHACCGPGKYMMCSEKMDTEHRVRREMERVSQCLNSVWKSLCSLPRSFYSGLLCFGEKNVLVPFFIIGTRYLISSCPHSCSLWIKGYLVSWQGRYGGRSRQPAGLMARR